MQHQRRVGALRGAGILQQDADLGPLPPGGQPAQRFDHFGCVQQPGIQAAAVDAQFATGGGDHCGGPG